MVTLAGMSRGQGGGEARWPGEDNICKPVFLHQIEHRGVLLVSLILNDLLRITGMKYDGGHGDPGDESRAGALDRNCRGLAGASSLYVGGISVTIIFTPRPKCSRRDH